MNKGFPRDRRRNPTSKKRLAPFTRPDFTPLPSYADRKREEGDEPHRRQGSGGDDSGLGEPIAQAQESADLPAFVAALLNLATARIREAERIFVISNCIDHCVGYFHKDVFPFGFICSSLRQA